MKKVLIITPNFPPISCPDMHRVRMALPFFREFGWQPLILKINPDEQEGIKDRELCETIPGNIKIWQSDYIPKKWVKWLSLNNIGLRSIFHLACLGDRIIEREQPRVIFFSTTMFPLMILGRYWHWRHKIPYILDLQDPWLSDYYKTQSKNITLPGSKLKYGFSQFMASKLEPKAMKYVDHITSVSSAYPNILQQRYPWLKSEQFTVLPFGAPQKDFELLPSLKIKQSIFDPQDGNIHWVYVGRGGQDMAKAIKVLFMTIKTNRQKNPQLWTSVKLHFVGTSYAPKGRETKTIEPLAISCGVKDLVTEHPLRIPYFEALQVLKDSQGILLIGSDDPNYSASKIYPCILAEKPILGIFHEQSLVVDVMAKTEAGEMVTFTSASQAEDLIPQLTEKVERLFKPDLTISKTNWSAFEPYTAKSMTSKLCQLFNQCALS